MRPNPKLGIAEPIRCLILFQGFPRRPKWARRDRTFGEIWTFGARFPLPRSAQHPGRPKCRRHSRQTFHQPSTSDLHRVSHSALSQFYRCDSSTLRLKTASRSACSQRELFQSHVPRKPWLFTKFFLALKNQRAYIRRCRCVQLTRPAIFVVGAKKDDEHERKRPPSAAHPADDRGF